MRIPAAWTHLVGIKPQRGRISTWPLPEAFNGITVNGVLARTVTDAALVLDAASGNVPGDLHTSRRRSRCPTHVARAPGPLRIALSTKFPFTVFRAKLHPEIRAALRGGRAPTRTDSATPIVAADPDYDLRMSWNFLSRSTSGLLDWVDRLGHRRHLRPAHRGQHADGPAAVGARAAQGPRPARPSRSSAHRLHLQPRRRGARADDRAAAAHASHDVRQLERSVHRPRDDPGLSGDLAVEPARLAVDQRARRASPPTGCRSACN